MDGGARRVHSLKIRAADGSQLHRAVYFLEEAFRTASLSGLPPNAEILVRRLDLGPIQLDGPVSALAARISERARDLATKAVRGDRDTAGTADVVWFADCLQAYQVLLRRLLDGRQAREWYWRSLFPGLRLSPGPASVGLLLLESRRTSAGELAPCYLLQSCLESTALSALIAWLAPETAERLLRDLDLYLDLYPEPAGGNLRPSESRLEPGPGAVASERLAPLWRHALRQATRTWGAGDPRAIWFAASALLIHQPAYLEQRDSLRRMLHPEDPGQGPSSGAWWKTGADGEIRVSPGPVPDSSGESARGHQEAPTTSAHRSVPTLSEPDTRDAEISLMDQGRGEPPDSGSVRRGYDDQVEPAAPLTGQGAPGERRTRTQQCPDHLRGGGVIQRGQERTDDLLQEGPVPRGAGVQGTEHAAKRSQADPDRGRTRESFAQMSDQRPPFSDRAGFAYLVPLLQRIGLAELLSEHAQLLSAGLARRLLLSMARRLGLDRGDPNWQLFEDWLPMEAPTHAFAAVDSFIAPEIWWRMAGTRSGPLRRFRVSGTGKDLITAPGGRWPLSYGDTLFPNRVPLNGPPLADAGMYNRAPGVGDLSNALQLVAGNWLRSHCGLSLRTLVRRPGTVAVTRSHWDAIFDLDQSDLRLRRVALDADPGWVSWLGKVVQFHFGHYG